MRSNAVVLLLALGCLAAIVGTVAHDATMPAAVADDAPPTPEPPPVDDAPEPEQTGQSGTPAAAPEPAADAPKPPSDPNKNPAVIAILKAIGSSHDDLLKQLVKPDVPAAVASPPNGPSGAAPAVNLPAAPKLTLTGPTAGPRGFLPIFTASVDGEYDALKWSVTPAVDGLLVLSDPRQATFGRPEPAVYTIRCTISGARRIAECELEYEILPDEDPKPGPQGANHPVAPAPLQAAPLTLEQQIVGEINKVTTAARAPEARIVGAAFRSVANRIDAGLFPAGADPITEVVKQVNGNLPNNAAWANFYQWATLQTAVMQQHGMSPAGFLHAVATVMAQVK